MKAMKKPPRIYLDHAALTLMDPRVLQEMRKYSAPAYANPSALYKEGVAGKKALEESREGVARFLNAHADEIIFTSGGTEANGLALEGAGRAFYRALQAAGRADGVKPHLIISAIEHSSIMECAAMLERQGVEVTRLPVDRAGLVSSADVKKAIKPSTFLVSIMAVNNEIGSVQPIREIAKVIRQYRKGIENRIEGAGIVLNPTPYPLLHTDAAQAPLYLGLNVEQLGVDFLTLDSSKACGPRGIGALYVKRSVMKGAAKPLLERIIYGGGQEQGLRSGTENVATTKGFAEALELAAEDRKRETKRMAALKASFLIGLLKISPDIVVNPSDDPNASHSSASFGNSDAGNHSEHSNIFNFSTSESGTSDHLNHANKPNTDDRHASKNDPELFTVSPHILNVSIPAIRDSELFVLRLDAAGIACSTKSSCLRDADESYVLRAIGADSARSVRFSFGRSTTKGDINQALKAIARILETPGFV